MLICLVLLYHMCALCHLNTAVEAYRSCRSSMITRVGSLRLLKFDSFMGVF